MNELLKLNRPWIKNAQLYEKLDDWVKCGLCERRCLIPPNNAGFCQTRLNIEGNLFTLVYGNISSISANPIEKKPFYHFWPGSVALTCGSWSCNFECPWCQNWHISKTPPNSKSANYLDPIDFIRETMERHCQGTSISFNEPSLMFEYSLDVFRLARSRGLYTTFVTNGYMTEKALHMLHEAGLDAINIDVKGDAEVVRKYCGGDVEMVWRNIREAKKLGIHLEVVNLVIPGVNDREEQLRWLAKRHCHEAGEDTPLHFTAYYPAYRFQAPPTPVSTLERAHDIAIGEGIEFVYIGNVPGHKYENTYCPSCGELLLRRYGLELLKSQLKGNRCPKCGREIPIVGKISI